MVFFLFQLYELVNKKISLSRTDNIDINLNLLSFSSTCYSRTFLLYRISFTFNRKLKRGAVSCRFQSNKYYFLRTSGIRHLWILSNLLTSANFHLSAEWITPIFSYSINLSINQLFLEGLTWSFNPIPVNRLLDQSKHGLEYRHSGSGYQFDT